MAKTKKAKGAHYVNNKKFLAAMVEFKEKCKVAEEKEKEQPPISNYIGECFLKIATHLSYRPNFINYTFRDDLVSDGIENCLLYAHNFDPEKSKNPFSYFTQIIHHAFVRRIQKEKKQMHLKYLYVEKSGIMEQVSVAGEDNVKQVTTYIEYLRTHEKYAESPYQSQKKKNRIKNLEKFM